MQVRVAVATRELSISKPKPRNVSYGKHHYCCFPPASNELNLTPHIRYNQLLVYVVTEGLCVGLP
jgi:hypothetical protein